MEQNLQPVYDLTQRSVPWLRPYVQFSLISSANGEMDRFELQSSGTQILIGGTSLSAMTMGLNHYLKYYCYRSASHCGNNLEAVDPIPVIGEKIIISTPFQYRYALNYCTFDYTMAFWKWDRWEKELDWMALNGVNLMLVCTGTKAIWQKILERFGYDNKEIHAFLPGPVYNAWWLMGNLEGWGGIAAQGLINQQVLLTQKILARMKELGIEAIFPGFYGVVPRSLKKKKPDAAIVAQGKWNNVFERPDILVCTNPLFDKTAKAYYDVVKKIYGDFKFFSGDPFHEGGTTQGLDVRAEAAAIHQAMMEAVPGSIWVLQAWYGNPKQELLDGIKNKQQILILDLFGEVTKEWETREAFSGSPFIWCSINNFGEKNGLFGRLEKIASQPLEALQSPYRRYMKGIGAIPEGIANNPVVYDMIFDAAWRPEKFVVKDWLADYACYRYGKRNEEAIQAWQYLLQTAYSSSDKYQEGPSESVFCARPSMIVASASTWGTRYLYYDNSLLEQAALLLLSAAEELGDKETYRYDLIDITRQVVANYGQQEYDELVKAFHHKDLRAFNEHSKAFLDLLLLQDELLSSHTSFMLGTWLKEAKAFRKYKTEKDICEWNARVLITWWGPDDPQTSLHDYANKEWSGLLKDYYYPRWKVFLDAVRGELLEFEIIHINYFSFEKAWTKQRKQYPLRPRTDCIKKVRNTLKKLEKYKYEPLVRH